MTRFLCNMKADKKRVFSREEILKKHKAVVKLVDVPEWGGCIRVCPLPWPEIMRMKSQFQDESERSIAMAIASCSDLKDEDFKALREGNGFVFSQLITAIMGAISSDDEAEMGN